MARIPFPEYLPDVSDNNFQGSHNILNVVPLANGYGPFRDFTAFATATIPGGVVRGYFFARNADATVTIFAGSPTNLYMLNPTTLSWTPVSAGGGYTALAPNALWQFAQYENNVFAVQANINPQYFTLGVSATFAPFTSNPNFPVGGSPPPVAAFVAVISGFVMLSGLVGSTAGGAPLAMAVQWSDLYNPFTWTAGTAQADYQIFPDGGLCRTFAGFDLSGILFQDAAIRSFAYAPGSPTVFNITKIADKDGIWAPYSMCIAQQTVFFISPMGFKMIQPGGFPVPIGKEKVDRTFFTNVDRNHPEFIQAASDPNSTRVFFTYKSLQGAQGAFDTILGYDWALERFVPIKVSGQCIAPLSAPGQTLEGLDPSAPGQVAITNAVTSPSNGGYPRTAFLGYVSGSTLTVVAGPGRPIPANWLNLPGTLAIGQQIQSGGGTSYGTIVSGPGTSGQNQTWTLSGAVATTPANTPIVLFAGWNSTGQPAIRLTLSGGVLQTPYPVPIPPGEAYQLAYYVSGTGWVDTQNYVEVQGAVDTFYSGGAGGSGGTAFQSAGVENGSWPYQVAVTSGGYITQIDIIGPTYPVMAGGTASYASGGAIGGSVDQMTLSFDYIAQSAQTQLSIFNAAGVLGFFAGPYLEAQLETQEAGDTEGQRMWINGIRIITDAPTVYGSVSMRDSIQQQVYYYTGEQTNNQLGICPLRADTRYSRGKGRIPYGSIWTYAAAVEPIFDPTGYR